MALLATPAVAAKPTTPITVSYGNNLSNPAIFAEGIGLTGLPTAEVSGLRGSSVPSLTEPYSFNGVNYYLQNTINTWRADWAQGATSGEVARLDWSDNIVRQTWTENSVIRVENVMFKDLLTPMNGYDMTFLYKDGLNEIWGTQGNTLPSNLATIYSSNARLKIEKLDAQNGSPVGTLYDSAIYERYGVDGPTSAYSAEVNASGKLIYGFNWDLAHTDMAALGLADVPKSGWYRLTFGIDPQANYSITDENGVVTNFSVASNATFGSLEPTDLAGYVDPDPVLYAPKLVNATNSTIDVYIQPVTSKRK